MASHLPRPTWFLVFVALGCSSTAVEPPRAASPDAEVILEDEAVASCERRLTELEGELMEEQESLRAARLRATELEELLGKKTEEANRLEERLRSTESEWKTTVEALLRPESSHRRIDSRPLAVSRISEIRVQLQALEENADEEIEARLERARELLSKADEALSQGNPAGAGFFAERAADLLRQATMVKEFRTIAGNEDHLPLVPQRIVRVMVPKANLRQGPGLQFERIATVEGDTELDADARSGEWFRIVTASGLTGWIHGSLLE